MKDKKDILYFFLIAVIIIAFFISPLFLYAKSREKTKYFSPLSVGIPFNNSSIDKGVNIVESKNGAGVIIITTIPVSSTSSTTSITTTTVYIPTTTSSISSTTTIAPPEVKEFIAIGENQAILLKWKELARRLGFLNIHREGVNKGIVLTYRKAAPPTGLPEEGRSYQVGDMIGDGQVIYVGSGIQFFHQGLENGTPYFYEAFGFVSEEESIKYSEGVRAYAVPKGLITLSRELIPMEYDLISIPCHPSFSGDANKLFGDELGEYDPGAWRIFHFNSETNQYDEYPDMAPIDAGLGYWMITLNGGVISLTGETTDATVPYIVSIPPGWQQIGAPYNYEVLFSDSMVSDGVNIVEINSPQNIYIENVLWAYKDGGYLMSGAFVPWQGYWVHNISDKEVTLIITNIPRRYYEAFSSKGKPSHKMSGSGWYIRLKGYSGPWKDIDNYIGERADAQESKDIYDILEPPRFSDKQLSIYIRSIEGEKMASDFRGIGEDIERFEVIIEGGVGMVNLEWEIGGVIPEDIGITLSDEATGQMIDMKGYSSYNLEIKKGEKRRIFILVTP